MPIGGLQSRVKKPPMKNSDFKMITKIQNKMFLLMFVCLFLDYGKTKHFVNN